MSLNSSAGIVYNLIEMIDMAIINAHAIGMDNFNRSTALRNTAAELCTLAGSLEEVYMYTHTIAYI